MLRLTLLFLLLSCGCCQAQQVMLLYPAKIPNSRAVPEKEKRTANAQVDSLTSNVTVPTLSVYLPENGRANGAAVIICPGGGYHTLLTKREGSDVARAFNMLGVTAFVLKYRLPSDRTMEDKTVGPLQDAQQALKMVRVNARKWGIDPSRIGLMGFSAGGHLAATAGTHYGELVIDNTEKVSLRPDFLLLINPVISFTDAIGHAGSRTNLLGPGPTAEKINYFSNERHVNGGSPPTFLVHAGGDQVVPVANSLAFYQALQTHGVPAGLHIYAKGEHGFLTAPGFEEWFGRCVHWLKSMAFLP
jgi:acetyl esterase/lipase